MSAEEQKWQNGPPESPSEVSGPQANTPMRGERLEKLMTFIRETSGAKIEPRYQSGIKTTNNKQTKRTKNKVAKFNSQQGTQPTGHAHKQQRGPPTQTLHAHRPPEIGPSSAGTRWSSVPIVVPHHTTSRRNHLVMPV